MAPKRARSTLLAVALVLGGSPGCEGRRPNVLLIAVDTLRADALGAYGYPRPTSPSIDALLASSVVFDDVQASSAWTLPSFASLMTSLHAASHRCRTFSSRLAESHTTLAEILRLHGYATAAVVAHHFLDARYGLAQGFTEYDESLALALEESHRAVSSPGVHQRADAWLRRRASDAPDEPWLLWVHWFDPHHDYREHEGFTEKFGAEPRDRYDGEIAFTDAHVGKLLATLRDVGADAHTIVVFVTDHGEEFGDHGLEGHGRSLHREVARLALGIHVPGWAARRVAEPVHAVDLLPTLLELTGVPAPDVPLAGRSLVPSMRGAVPEPRGLLAEVSLYPGHVRSTYRLGRFKLFAHHRRDAPPGYRLYDVERDPLETTDVGARHPSIVEEYASALREERAAARALGDRLGAEEHVDLGPDDLERLRALGYAESPDGGASERRTQAAGKP